MNGNIDWRELFLSAEGRLARTPFVIAAAVMFVLAFLYEAVAGETLHWVTGWVVYPALLYVGACLISKRLHDRGRSGWYAALVLAALIAVWSSPVGFLDFLFVMVLVWAVIELGVLSGEQGANRFGANPVKVAVG